MGRRLRLRDAFPGRGLDDGHLRAAGIELVPRLIRANGTTAGFVDGTAREVAAVIWATGYRDDSRWVLIPQASDELGSFVRPGDGRPEVGDRAPAEVLGNQVD
jgi:putative flavoprotein involved in K+ transport